jgi:ribosomal protein L40E
LLNLDNAMIGDEKGAFFVFGPWWFVIIVMILGFIFSMSRSNTTKENNNINQLNDYEPIQNSTKTMVKSNICPQCGKNNSISAEFCRGCGSNLIDYSGIFCPECGEKNLLNAKFCQECGKELE